MKKKRIHIFLFLISNWGLYAQTDQLNQFWNEFAFTKDLSQKWIVEFNLGSTTSSVRDDSNIFHNVIQVYGRVWAHYSPNDRWKVSLFYAYFYNKNVPELDQKETPEFRIAGQGIYRLVKDVKFKVNLRARLEDRHLQNEEGYFEAVMRFRFQVRTIYSFTNNDVNKNAVYAFVSDELFLKSKSQVSGPDLFDRNRATIGMGYFLTDNIQIEISYANEIMPRKPVNHLVNAFQVNVVFNNFLPNLIKSIKPKKPVLE